MFEDIGHSNEARKTMEKYLIGKLKVRMMGICVYDAWISSAHVASISYIKSSALSATVAVVAVVVVVVVVVVALAVVASAVVAVVVVVPYRAILLPYRFHHTCI